MKSIGIKLLNVLKSILVTILEVFKLPFIILAILFDCNIDMKKDNTLMIYVKTTLYTIAGICDILQMILCDWIEKLNSSVSNNLL